MRLVSKCHSLARTRSRGRPIAVSMSSLGLVRMPEHQRVDSATIERWLGLLLASTSETAVLVLSTEGEILGWRGAARRLFGYTTEEAVGMPISRLFTPEDVAAELDRQERELALSARRSEDDRWHVRKDGSRFWGSGVMEPILDVAGNVVALAKTLRDRTDVRTQVVAMHNRAQAAEARNTAQLHALTALTHELRNQVAPLVNSLSLLERNGADGKLTERMRHQLDTTRRLLDDLAQAAEVVATTPTIILSFFDVRSLLVRVAESLSGQAQQRRQTLKVTVPDAPITLQADAHRLDQILVNLVSNASKFTPAGGSIHLSATVEDDMVAIRVEDDGDGIPGDVLPRIFELFTREQRSGAPQGMGVGLSVVKTLVELHGGFVEGRSPGRGQGSVFTVRLPLRARAASQACP